MQTKRLTVGTAPVPVPVDKSYPIVHGLRLLHVTAADAAESVSVSFAEAAAVAGGPDTNTLPKGAPGEVDPYPVMKETFDRGIKVYLVATAPGQVVEIAAI